MTKAQVVAKHLKQSNCRVIMIETHKYWMVASRFSSNVDRFVTIPIPEQDEIGYQTAIRKIAEEEKADLFIPVSSPIASIQDSRVEKQLPKTCRSLSLGALTDRMDDKDLFTEMVKTAGLEVPTTVRMTTKQQVVDFNTKLIHKKGIDDKKQIFKSIQYDSMHRLDQFTLPCHDVSKLNAYLVEIDISETKPWVCQEYLQGDEQAVMCLAQEGKMLYYTANLSSMSCLNYIHCPDTNMYNWMEQFVDYQKVSGIFCVDFIIDKNKSENGTKGALHIECNPRFHSNIVNFQSHPEIGNAQINPELLINNQQVLTPAKHLETCWIGNEIQKIAFGIGQKSIFQRVYGLQETLTNKKDAQFDTADPLPFLALYQFHVPIILLRQIWKGNTWVKIDLCIGKLTEINGD